MTTRFRHIATALIALNIRTPQGFKWYPSSVRAGADKESTKGWKHDPI